MSEKIDYQKLSTLLELATKELESGRLECLKHNPDEIIICDHVIENLGSLFDQISACIFPNNFSSEQSDKGSLRKDIIDVYDSINSLSKC